ncbi:MAG: hypothetical protein HOB73_13665 [Planctomycetaceae bacterium]|jgi:hypothetical protein|nr:hypothetical protein [Planctomycetaceae bacterium]
MASQTPSNPYQFESQTPFATAAQNQQLPKPKAIKVFGILNVIFGGLGLLFTCIGLGAILAITSDLIPVPDGQANPAIVKQNENAFLYVYNITSAMVALFFTIVLLISGIGLLKNKKWGRTAGLAWSGYCVLATIVVLVVTWTHIYPYQLETMDEATAAVPNIEAVLMGAMIFSNVLSVGFLIYPGLFALFSSKQPFKDALD